MPFSGVWWGNVIMDTLLHHPTVLLYWSRDHQLDLETRMRWYFLKVSFFLLFFWFNFFLVSKHRLLRKIPVIMCLCFSCFYTHRTLCVRTTKFCLMTSCSKLHLANFLWLMEKLSVLIESGRREVVGCCLSAKGRT